MNTMHLITPTNLMFAINEILQALHYCFLNLCSNQVIVFVIKFLHTEDYYHFAACFNS